ncbi:MAG: TIGR03086 family metal-binding protein [Actinomycetota bacterium]
MATDDQLRGAMAKAMEGFAAAVTAVEPHHWERPSPCSEWSVWDVINHVVGGEHFTAAVLGGASLAAAVESQVGLDPHAADLVSQVVDASAVALAAFEGSLDRTVEHRVGTITARRMLGFRIIDELGHTWDIATAIGQSAILDADALAIGTEIALTERATLERSPNFATSPHDRGTPAGSQLAVFLHTIGRTVP